VTNVEAPSKLTFWKALKTLFAPLSMEHSVYQAQSRLIGHHQGTS